MNIFKHIETAFTGATAIAITGAALLLPDAAAVAAAQQASMPVQVVVVSAKRLTPEQKLQSLLEERQLAAVRQRVARS